MNLVRHIQPVPPEIAAELLELVEQFRAGELAQDEYNQKMRELQARIDEQNGTTPDYL